MRKTIIAAVIVLLAASTYFFGCSKKVTPTENVDLVNGIPAVNNLSAEHMATLNDLAKLKPSQIGPYLMHNWPTLKADIKGYVTHYGYISLRQVVDSVTFLYGTDSNVTAVDKSFKTHSGHFTNQLIAKFWIHGQKPMYFFVQCTNGMSYPADHNDARLARIPIADWFTIDKPGSSLMTYINYKDAMRLGQKFHLPVYTTDKSDPDEAGALTKITYRKAWKLKEHNPDRLTVVIPVYLGDRFSASLMKYEHARN